MKRLAVVLASAAAVIAVPALVIGTSSASSSHHQRHFSVVSHDAQGTITPADFGASPEQNQQASADAPVSHRGRKVGRTETVLTITRVTSNDLEVDIECTVELPTGNLLFNGAFNLNDISDGVVVPVVGGTGKYRGAAGTVILKSPDPTKTRLVFDLVRP